MIFSRRTVSVALGLMILCGSPTAFALEFPVNDGFVTDHLHVMTYAQERLLEKQLVQYEKLSGNEIAVVTIDTFGDEDPLAVAKSLGNAWGIGKAGTNNGIVMMFGYQDRQMVIATGDGVTDVLTNDVLTTIIEKDFVHAFRKKQYYRGFVRGFNAIKAKLRMNKPLAVTF